jgi:methylphosphotriester-DNA--protein-cysteine methyltransferase
VETTIERINSTSFMIHRAWRTIAPANGIDVMGPLWMLAKISAKGPAFYWSVDGQKVYPSNQENVVAFFPPYSWSIEYAEAGTDWRAQCLLSKESLPSGVPQYPCLLEGTDPFPNSLESAFEYLRTARRGASISLRSSPNALASRIKEAIDRGFHDDISMGEIAERLNSSSSYLSRVFKAEFGFPPQYYKNALKVSYATFSLTAGRSPADAAADAGYKDLSRFYKQFSDLVKSPPSVVRAKSEKSKNAKT